MCSWAADASKLLRPLSRLIVQGVDSTPFADVDSWLLALRAWLEVDDTLKVSYVIRALQLFYQSPSSAPSCFTIRTQGF